MKKYRMVFFVLLFLGFFVPVLHAGEVAVMPAPAAGAVTPTSWVKERVKFSGLLFTTYAAQKNTYFNKDVSASYFETTARLGVNVSPVDDLDINFGIIGEQVSGHAAKYTGVNNHSPLVQVELANVKVKNLLDQPLELTVGRQNLEFGDGFLLYDFHTDKRTPWTGFERSLGAGRLTYKLQPFTIDLFAGQVDKSYKSYEAFYYDFKTYKGRRNIYGGNVRWDYGESGTWDLLCFYKEDQSLLASNTVAISNRVSVPVIKSPFALTLVGEAVPQLGTTNVASNYLDSVKHDRKAFGGHGDAIVGLDLPWKPEFKFSYIYFSGDNPKTRVNEGYDPMFYGFKDWDNWSMGSINSSNLFNTNDRIFLYKVAVHPTARTTAQFFYKQFYLNSPIYNYPYPVDAGRQFANESTVVVEWRPKEWLFCGFELGALHPQKAGIAFNGGFEKDTMEAVAFVAVGF